MSAATKLEEMKKMRSAVLFVALVAFAAAANGADMRPPFDKSDYKGTVAVQVNPWFPLNKPPKHALGGPNIAYMRDLDWRKGMPLFRRSTNRALGPESGASFWMPRRTARPA